MPEASRIARKLSALVDLGLERADVSPVSSEAVRVHRNTYRVTFGKAAMGTLVSAVVMSPSKDRAEEAVGRAFEEMDRLISIFSRFDGGSAVSHLNSDGRLHDSPPEFSHVISQSLHFHNLSRGAFDVSVEPVVDLFRESMDGNIPAEPTQAEILEALELVGSGDIAVSERVVDFRRSGMRITLDGIAKGHIVDAFADVLRRHRIKNYLINAGGDIRAAGAKERRQPWTVAVQDPAKNEVFPDTIHLRDCAVATSGSYEVYFDRDKLFHHIVNSRTGRSPNVSTSVSVVAPSTIAADALATSVFVMEPHQGVEFVNSLPGCACLIIDQDGRQLKSKDWKSAAPINGAEAEA